MFPRIHKHSFTKWGSEEWEIWIILSITSFSIPLFIISLLFVKNIWPTSFKADLLMREFEWESKLQISLKIW